MIEAIVSILGAAMVGVIGWAVKLESRVSVQEQRHNDLLTLIETKFESQEQQLITIDKKLDRLDRKVFNGSH